MQKINYGLIISDFDGTLVADNGEICQKNKIAIAQYIKDGGKFAISTGRVHYGILPRARELGLQGAMSCCQGAVIMDIQSGKPLINNAMTHELTVELCQRMEKLGLHIHLYGEKEYYSNMDDEPLKAYEKAVQMKATLVLDKPLSVFAKEQGICTYKLVAMIEPSQAKEIIQALKVDMIDGCEVTQSAPYLVEIINAKFSKGTAVEFLANYYGVPLEKTIGVGDQLNDIPMIEKAGLGIAVKNADERLKEKAVVIDYTNEEGAVAEVIKKYGYMEE